MSTLSTSPKHLNATKGIRHRKNYRHYSREWTVQMMKSHWAESNREDTNSLLLESAVSSRLRNSCEGGRSLRCYSTIITIFKKQKRLSKNDRRKKTRSSYLCTVSLNFSSSKNCRMRKTSSLLKEDILLSKSNPRPLGLLRQIKNTSPFSLVQSPWWNNKTSCQKHSYDPTV